MIYSFCTPLKGNNDYLPKNIVEYCTYVLSSIVEENLINKCYEKGTLQIATDVSFIYILCSGKIIIQCQCKVGKKIPIFILKFIKMFQFPLCVPPLGGVEKCKHNFCEKSTLIKKKSILYTLFSFRCGSWMVLSTLKGTFRVQNPRHSTQSRVYILINFIIFLLTPQFKRFR
jgi:hypothetical protein